MEEDDDDFILQNMAFWMHCLHSRLGENVINSNLILLNTTIVFLLFAEETSAGGFSRQEKGTFTPK